jgi:hypothetical protein
MSIFSSSACAPAVLGPSAGPTGSGAFADIPAGPASLAAERAGPMDAPRPAPVHNASRLLAGRRPG